MRFYFRTGRGSGVSVGIFGALVLLAGAAAVWTFAAGVLAVAVLLACVAYTGRWVWQRLHR